MSEDQAKMTTTQAREAVEGGLRTFRAFETLHGALKNLESLEQNLVETGARVNAIRATEADLQKGKADADNAVKDAISKAAGILRNANAEAQAIADDARKNASKVLGDAKEEAKQLKTGAQAEMDNLLGKTADLKNQHSALDASLKAKNAELDVVTHTLKQHRESLEKFLKG